MAPSWRLKVAPGYETDNTPGGGRSQRLITPDSPGWEIFTTNAGGAQGRGLIRDTRAMSRRTQPVSASKRRQLEGSRRGSAAVKAEFDSAITRRRYAELVGIHATTLQKWERHGVVKPRLATILNSPTRVFTNEDVEFGKKLIALLRQRPGELSVKDAARKID